MIFAGRPFLRPTFVGRDVWIGVNCTIMAGVSIGDGAIIAAGSVVTTDVPAFEVHGGVPNRRIGQRFEADMDRLKHREYLAQEPKEGQYCEWRY